MLVYPARCAGSVAAVLLTCTIILYQPQLDDIRGCSLIDIILHCHSVAAGGSLHWSAPAVFVIFLPPRGVGAGLD